MQSIALLPGVPRGEIDGRLVAHERIVRFLKSEFGVETVQPVASCIFVQTVRCTVPPKLGTRVVSIVKPCQRRGTLDRARFNGLAQLW